MKPDAINGKKNVFGKPLVACCHNPLTGYFRDGYCRTDNSDHGQHVICTEMTDEFLVFSRQQGNDLSTPRPEFNFPGLKAGDFWCLCALRWKEAWEHGMAPRVRLDACDETALTVVSLSILTQYAIPSTS